MYISHEWKDYEILDVGDGDKFERWGDVTLLRPDPQAVWPMGPVPKPDARYIRSAVGGGAWEYNRQTPESWRVRLGELTFIVRPTGFKHTGLFPEQAVNWRWMQERIKVANRPVRVLNLFGYTGGATVACAAAGAEVVHVDAAKGMVAWCKDNVAASGLREKNLVRYIVDDVLKFVQREERRGRTYQGILMDPPSYGRGPDGEVWKIEENLFPLVDACMKIVAPDPVFFLINSYTTGLAPSVLKNILVLTMGARFGGTVEAKEVSLPVTNRDIILPCGASGRWQP